MDEIYCIGYRTAAPLLVSRRSSRLGPEPVRNRFPARIPTAILPLLSSSAFFKWLFFSLSLSSSFLKWFFFLTCRKFFPTFPFLCAWFWFFIHLKIDRSVWEGNDWLFLRLLITTDLSLSLPSPPSFLPINWSLSESDEYSRGPSSSSSSYSSSSLFSFRRRRVLSAPATSLLVVGKMTRGEESRSLEPISSVLSVAIRDEDSLAGYFIIWT